MYHWLKSQLSDSPVILIIFPEVLKDKAECHSTSICWHKTSSDTYSRYSARRFLVGLLNLATQNNNAEMLSWMRHAINFSREDR